MGKIIRLRGSPHEQSQSLMPWYANGSLDGEEAALVEDHLAECAECREMLESERALASRVAETPLDVEHGWALLDDRLTRPVRLGRARPRLGRALRRRAAFAWAATAQLAAVGLAVIAFVSLRPAPVEPLYHALGGTAAPAGGNVVILFAPDATTGEVRNMLDGVGGRLVDGPTTTGAFLLRIPPERRDQAVARLRRSPLILLAEPLDSGSRR